jgi:DNA-binding MarR family transcriptional regulator
MERPKFDDLGLLISLARRLVWMATSRRLEENGYSMIAWVLIGHISRVGPTTQREIATGSGQHPAGVSRVVDELEEAGLVRRRRDAKDRRRVSVEPTRKGLAHWEAAKPLVIGAMNEALSPLTKEEQRALRKLLRKLVLASPGGAECEPSAARIIRSVRAAKEARRKTA